MGGLWKIKFVKIPFHLGMSNEERGKGIGQTKRHSSKTTKIKGDRPEEERKQINKFWQTF